MITILHYVSHLAFQVHYQALWLFLKGIVFVPHPKGSESTATRTIAAIMAPFFTLRDVLKPSSKTNVTVAATKPITCTNGMAGGSGGKDKSV